MNRIGIALLLVASVWVAGPQTAPATISVLTYNIHHGVGRDNRFDLARIAAVVNGAHPDLVALQEVDRGTSRTEGVDQVAELARMTDMHSAFGKAIDYQGGHYGVAVLSRWPLVSTRNDPLPGMEGREKRTALTVKVRAAGLGPLLQFTSTHLDQGPVQENRLTQANYLNELLVRDHSPPTILAGDMNARLDSVVMNLFHTFWLNPLAAQPAFVPPVAAAAQRGPGGPNRGFGFRSDYVLVRPATNWRVVETTVLDEAVASDHRPVLVVLEWTGSR